MNIKCILKLFQLIVNSIEWRKSKGHKNIIQI